MTTDQLGDTDSHPSRPAPVDTAQSRQPWRKRVLLGGLVLCFLLLAGAGAVAGYLAFTNKERADLWEARAAELEGEVAALEGLVAERTDDLNERTEDLNAMAAKIVQAERAIARSEADVSSLEQRQRLLANEKAQVEDARAALALQASAMEDVASAFIECNDGLVEYLGYIVEEDYLSASSEYDRISGYCQDADDRLAGYLAGQGG